jgi:ribonuclease III
MFFKKIYNLYFSPHKAFAKKIRKITGFTPLDIEPYILAFKHKSRYKESNERLEFLGDSILDAVVTEELYYKYQKGNEGDLSKLRSKIVSRKRLNIIGNELNLLSLLKYRSMQMPQGETNLAGNTLEALVGAVYIDFGFRKTAVFVRKKILKPYIDWSKLSEEITDYKSILHTYTQRENLSLQFIVLSEKPQHDLSKFEVEVLVGEKSYGKGAGKNKKAAEQAASHNALIKLNVIR